MNRSYVLAGTDSRSSSQRRRYPMAVQESQPRAREPLPGQYGQAGRDAVAGVLGHADARRPCPKGDRCRPGSRRSTDHGTPSLSAYEESQTDRSIRREPPWQSRPSTHWREPGTWATAIGTGITAVPIIRERPGLIRPGASGITQTSGHDYPSHDRRDDQADSTRTSDRPRPRTAESEASPGLRAILAFSKATTKTSATAGGCVCRPVNCFKPGNSNVPA